MTDGVLGLHHVTCISGNAQENLDFYTGVMGMRLVKRSVNQDAPDTYHLFYADGLGTPGTDLTFFPWPAMGPGRKGVGLAEEVCLSVPQGSLAYWQARLVAHGVQVGDRTQRFGEVVLPFRDGHGLSLALVEAEIEHAFLPWTASPVPPDHQVRGLHAVRLCERELAPTAALISSRLGFTPLGEDQGWLRFGAAGGAAGCLLDVQPRPQDRRGEWGTGSIHHVAWRVRDDREQMRLRVVLEEAGLRPTQPIDRFWFKSVYFREPGGVLFELATDGPGFTLDEQVVHLGEQLILPPWLEGRRSAIEASLPPLTMPQAHA